MLITQRRPQLDIRGHTYQLDIREHSYQLDGREHSYQLDTRGQTYQLDIRDKLTTSPGGGHFSTHDTAATRGKTVLA